MSTLSFFLVVAGGTALAASVEKNSVKSSSIKDEAVMSKDLKNEKAVASEDVIDDSITEADLGASSVTTSELGTIMLEQNSVQVGAGAEGTADVECDPGTVMLSGGGYWTTSANNLRTSLKQGNGWRVEGKNTVGASPLIVQAYCLAP